jgi:hypothetical protein
MASGVVPAMQVRNRVVAELAVVLSAVEKGIDLGVVALLLQDREVAEHLLPVLRSAAQQVFVVELDEAIGVAVLEEARAIQRALGHGAHQLAHIQVAIAEQRFSAGQALIAHQILAAQHLLIHRADDRVQIIVGGMRPVLFALSGGKTLNAQGRCLNERHNVRAGRVEPAGP